jgi:hypothetical protein
MCSIVKESSLIFYRQFVYMYQEDSGKNIIKEEFEDIKGVTKVK